jgi:hypothetical protein
LTFALTRVERSLFYPAVGPIGINEIYTSSMIVVIVTRQVPPSSLQGNRLLPAERAALGQASLTTGRLAPIFLLAPFVSVFEVACDLQDLRAALADDDCVGVREDGGDGEASGALDVHEERAGGRHKGLELVLLGLTESVLVGRRGCAVGEGVRTQPGRG